MRALSEIVDNEDINEDLIVAATGERVIIVMGAVFIVVSRLSGTFIKKIMHCLEQLGFNCCKQCMMREDLSFLINHNNR